MERVGGEVVWDGHIGKVRVDRFRYDDGEEAEREIVEHPGSAGVVAHDGETLYLVRQPREPVNDPALLELPAGKLDHQGEAPLDAAKRELAEEIGNGAEEAEADENERIEIVEVPMSDLDSVIRDCRDSKTLVGLLWLRASLNR